MSDGPKWAFQICFDDLMGFYVVWALHNRWYRWHWRRFWTVEKLWI